MALYDPPSESEIIMSEHVESVKKVAEYLHNLAEKSADREQLAEKLRGYADELDSARERLMVLEALTSALPPDLGNIHDLPQELLDELSVAKTDELEDQIVTVINAYGGEASLDQILVGLYRKFKVSQKRRFVQNKLYRMDMVWGVSGKKGVYTTEQPPLERVADAISTFGGKKQPVDEVEDEIPF